MASRNAQPKMRRVSSETDLLNLQVEDGLIERGKGENKVNSDTIERDQLDANNSNAERDVVATKEPMSMLNNVVNTSTTKNHVAVQTAETQVTEEPKSTPTYASPVTGVNATPLGGDRTAKQTPPVQLPLFIHKKAPVTPSSARDRHHSSVKGRVILSPPRPEFTPMEALKQKQDRGEVARHFTGEQKVRMGFPANYKGDITNWKNQNADIPYEENCSLWLQNLPAGTTVHHVLQALTRAVAIHKEVFDRIVVCHVTEARPHDGFFTAGCKLVTFTRAGAKRLFDFIDSGRLAITERIIQVRWNRIRAAELDAPAASRVLILKGPKKVVNHDTLHKLFKEKFVYQWQEIRVLTEEPGEEGLRTMEWQFGSFHAQAEVARMVIKSEWEGVDVKFGLDPCAVLPSSPPATPVSRVASATRVKGGHHHITPTNTGNHIAKSASNLKASSYKARSPPKMGSYHVVNPKSAANNTRTARRHSFSMQDARNSWAITARQNSEKYDHYDEIPNDTSDNSTTVNHGGDNYPNTSNDSQRGRTRITSHDSYSSQDARCYTSDRTTIENQRRVTDDSYNAGTHPVPAPIRLVPAPRDDDCNIPIPSYGTNTRNRVASYTGDNYKVPPPPAPAPALAPVPARSGSATRDDNYYIPSHDETNSGTRNQRREVCDGYDAGMPPPPNRGIPVRRDDFYYGERPQETNTRDRVANYTDNPSDTIHTAVRGNTNIYRGQDARADTSDRTTTDHQRRGSYGSSNAGTPPVVAPVPTRPVPATNDGNYYDPIPVHNYSTNAGDGMVSHRDDSYRAGMPPPDQPPARPMPTMIGNNYHVSNRNETNTSDRMAHHRGDNSPADGNNANWNTRTGDVNRRGDKHNARLPPGLARSIHAPRNDYYPIRSEADTRDRTADYGNDKHEAGFPPAPARAVPTTGDGYYPSRNEPDARGMSNHRDDSRHLSPPMNTARNNTRTANNTGDPYNPGSPPSPARPVPAMSGDYYRPSPVFNNTNTKTEDDYRSDNQNSGSPSGPVRSTHATQPGDGYNPAPIGLNTRDMGNNRGDYYRPSPASYNTNIRIEDGRYRSDSHNASMPPHPRDNSNPNPAPIEPNTRGMGNNRDDNRPPHGRTTSPPKLPVIFVRNNARIPPAATVPAPTPARPAPVTRNVEIPIPSFGPMTRGDTGKVRTDDGYNVQGRMPPPPPRPQAPAAAPVNISAPVNRDTTWNPPAHLPARDTARKNSNGSNYTNYSNNSNNARMPRNHTWKRRSRSPPAPPNMASMPGGGLQRSQSRNNLYDMRNLYTGSPRPRFARTETPAPSEAAYPTHQEDVHVRPSSPHGGNNGRPTGGQARQSSGDLIDLA